MSTSSNFSHASFSVSRGTCSSFHQGVHALRALHNRCCLFRSINQTQLLVPQWCLSQVLAIKSSKYGHSLYLLNYENMLSFTLYRYSIIPKMLYYDDIGYSLVLFFISLRQLSRIKMRVLGSQAIVVNSQLSAIDKIIIR